MVTTKTCSKCGVAKSRDAFGPRSGSPDGLRGQCRECRHASQLAWTRVDEIATRESARERTARWRARHPERAKQVNVECKARNPNHWRARNKVNHAIAAGNLMRPDSFMCLDCGGAATEYDHFLGYDPVHWLHVQPVCRPCHGKRRRKK